MLYPNEEQNSATVGHHYNELDPFYREIWGEHVHHGLWLTGRETPQEAVKQLVTVAAEALNAKPGMRLCDIGCGYGATARMFAEQWQARVTAMTLSQAQYAYAKAINPASHNPEYLLGDWLENRLPSNTYDAALSIESSEHMLDKPRFFAEAHRVLRPGGRFAVYAWLAKPAANALEVRYLLEPICREGRLPSMGTVDDYRLMMQAAGFRNIAYRDYTTNVQKTWRLCCWRALKAICTDKRYRLFLQKGRERSFAKTLLRIWIAYQVGSMRYGLFSADK